jgi:thioredoxin 1
MKPIRVLCSVLFSFAGLAILAVGLRGAATPATADSKTVHPRLVELGADKCVPCKLMAPVLAELAKEYVGQFEVVFIDVWKRPGEAKAYAIQVIPTQIFYDASGKERFRHEGFYSKKDILQKWSELGVKLIAKPAAAPAR